MRNLAAKLLRDIVMAVLTVLLQSRKTCRQVSLVPESRNVPRSIHEGNQVDLESVFSFISYPQSMVTPDPFDTS